MKQTTAERLQRENCGPPIAHEPGWGGYTVFTYSIKCPSCRRKIMNVRRRSVSAPKVVAMGPGDKTAYIEETRCPTCKTYIGIL